MSVIKAKNSKGDWEVVAGAANRTATIKYTIIEAATENTFDLSGLVAPGADFILIFNIYDSLNKPINDTVLIWDSRLNELSEKDVSTGSTSITVRCTWNQYETNKCDVSYDKDTCILTVSDNPGGSIQKVYLNHGYLYYAE